MDRILTFLGMISVCTYVNGYDVFIFKFTHMQIYMKDLSKSPISHVNIIALPST
jgi:hypothetical protein